MARARAPALSPRSIALVGVVAISFAAILVRAAGTSPSTAAVFRGAYALPVLAGLALWLGPDARPRRARLLAVGAGVLLGADLTVWHHSIGYIGAGLATVLANLQVVLVGLAAWILHGERPSIGTQVAVPVALVGVALTSGLGRLDAYGTRPVLGTALALAAAVAYTGYLLVFRQANRDQGPTADPLLDATLGLTATTLVLGLLTDPALSLVPRWPAHGYLLLLGAGVHTVGWLTIAYALPRLPAVTTSLLLLLQPTLTMVWGLLLFAETPSLVQWLGVALVLAALASATLWDALQARKEGGNRPPGSRAPS